MTLPLRRKRPTTRPSSSRPTAADRLATACAPVAIIVALASLVAATPANAAGWRPAGSAAHRAVQPAAWQGQGDGAQAAPANPPAEPQFDPFEEFDRHDVAMPAAETSGAAPGGVRPGGDDFDPFAEEEETAATPQDNRPTPRADQRDAGELEGQEAFGGPRRGSIGPSVEDQLEAADEAIEQELDRRDEEGPTAPADDRDPFQPGDAMDRPERNVEDAFPEPGTDDQQTDDSGDIQRQFQQAPGGFDIRPMAPEPAMTPEQREQRRQQLQQERLEAEQTCEEFIAAVRADNIRSVSLDIRMQGVAGEDYPFECGLGDELFAGRAWPQVTYLWKAAGLCHKPLYFEQVQAERYGHSAGPVLDPLVAGAHFFGTFPILPYKMGLMTPNECVYTLGYYRPGSCAPYMIPAVPFTWRAAAFEAGAWTGGAFAIP
jgi:hypothetical protein